MRDNYLKSRRFKVRAKGASFRWVLEGGVAGGPGCFGSGVM